VLITVDKDMPHQQNLRGRGISMIVLEGSTSLDDLDTLMGDVLNAVDVLQEQSGPVRDSSHRRSSRSNTSARPGLPASRAPTYPTNQFAETGPAFPRQVYFAELSSPAPPQSRSFHPLADRVLANMDLQHIADVLGGEGGAEVVTLGPAQSATARLSTSAPIRRFERRFRNAWTTPRSPAARTFFSNRRT
jgi:hypothetical protein